MLETVRGEAEQLVCRLTPAPPRLTGVRWDPHGETTIDRLTPSVLGRIFSHEFWVTRLFHLGRVYGGQKINGQSLYCFKLPK